MSDFHYFVTEEFVEFMAKAYADHPENTIFRILSTATVGSLIYTEPKK